MFSLSIISLYPLYLTNASEWEALLVLRWTILYWVSLFCDCKAFSIPGRMNEYLKWLSPFPLQHWKINIHISKCPLGGSTGWIRTQAKPSHESRGSTNPIFNSLIIWDCIDFCTFFEFQLHLESITHHWFLICVLIALGMLICPLSLVINSLKATKDLRSFLYPT